MDEADCIEPELPRPSAEEEKELTQWVIRLRERMQAAREQAIRILRRKRRLRLPTKSDSLGDS